MASLAEVLAGILGGTTQVPPEVAAAVTGAAPVDPMTGLAIGADTERTAPEAAPNRYARAALQSIGGIPKAALWDMPRDAVEAARNAPLPGDRTTDYSETVAPIAGAAMSIAGARLPWAKSGEVGVFGGRLAATADKAALATAEEMAAAGADRQAIWDKTGWFKGGDDKWRFEIPDNAAGLNPNTLKTMPEEGRISPVAGDVWHPKLYDAYPDVRSVKSYVEKGPESGVYQGSPGRDELIGINGPTAERGRSVALHELQHVIQAREGFARGGSPHAFAAEKASAEKSIDDVNALLRGQARDMDLYRATGNKEKLAEAKAEYDRLMDLKLQKFVPKAQIDPYESYRRLAGEVEARNVEGRRDMNLRQLHENPPWMTEDVPAAEQIFRDGGRVGSLQSGPQMSIPVRRTGYKAMDTDVPNMQPDTGLTHVAFDRRVAEQFSGGGKRKVNDVEVSAQKPFDYRDPKDLEWLVKEMQKPKNVAAYNRDTKKIMGPNYEHVADARYIQGGLEEGLYQAYEVPHIIDLIKRKGYDAIYMTEDAGAPTNLAVFHPSQIALAKGKK